MSLCSAETPINRTLLRYVEGMVRGQVGIIPTTEIIPND
jgi:hypothetical protein